MDGIFIFTSSQLDLAESLLILNSFKWRASKLEKIYAWAVLYKTKIGRTLIEIIV
jgi:hypothetical protein